MAMASHRRDDHQSRDPPQRRPQGYPGRDAYVESGPLAFVKGSRTRNGSGSQAQITQRNAKSSEFVREMPNFNGNRNSGNHDSRNQDWSEEDITANQHLTRRLSQDSGVTQVRSNTARRHTDTVVDDMKFEHNNNMASAPDVGGRHRNSGNGGNTSRIIAERKRRTTGSADTAQSHNNNGPRRRDPLVPPDHHAHDMRPKRRSDPERSSIRRVNTAAGELGAVGDSGNFEPQQLGPIRRVTTGGDLRAVQEHKAFGNSNISDIYDEFNDAVNNWSLRRKGSNGGGIQHNYYPSGVGSRRRTSRNSEGGGSRRHRRSSSRGSHRESNNPQSASDVDGDEFQAQLHQLRVNHHRQQQQHQRNTPQRPKRRSSMTASERSFEDDDGMAVMSAPLGGRLSDANNEIGGFLREAAHEANKSEHSWYMGRDASRSSRYDAMHSTSHSTSGRSLGISGHSRAQSTTSKAQSATSKTMPSGRTNDQRLFNDLLQGFNPGKRRQSGDDLLIGFTPRRRGRPLKWYERYSLSKRTILIAIGLVFLAVAMLGVVLLLNERGIGFGSGNESVSNNLPKPGDNVVHVKPPPSDIAGRCSASNLPGSLPACLEACYPAACCYSNFEGGTKCLDANDAESIKACSRYRPYCDIFHDTWDGATDGVLRTPRADLVPVCQQVSGRDVGNMSKLRARNLMVGTAEVICEQYCEAAKCCAVDTVVHPYSAGLELSASGVYTDARTKEHVVTNCQDALVYQKNKDLCAEYDKFCTWGDVITSDKSNAWTSRPTMDPASTMMPSSSPSNIPSMTPSSSSRPTPVSPQPSHAPSINVFTIQWITAITKRPIPSPSMSPSHSISPSNQFKPSSEPSLSSMPTISRADTTLVEASCAGADNIALMASGDEAARTKCLDACLNGLCCYTEQLGYSSFIESCYNGNEAVCEGYSDCLWLEQSGELTLEQKDDTTTITTANGNITNSDIVSNETIAVDADINALNSSIVSNETTETAEKITSQNTSIAVEGTSVPLLNSTVSSAVAFNSSAVNITDVTLATGVTTDVTVDSTSFTSPTQPTEIEALIVPPPPSDLAALCALGQGRFCTEVCKDVACCFEDAPELYCPFDNVEICEGYAPCSVLYPKS